MNVITAVISLITSIIKLLTVSLFTLKQNQTIKPVPNLPHIPPQYQQKCFAIQHKTMITLYLKSIFMQVCKTYITAKDRHLI